MLKYCAIFFILLSFQFAQCQNKGAKEQDSIKSQNDSIRRSQFLKKLGNGYITLGQAFEVDIKYLFKYNQHEAIRTGFGGVTNDEFSKRYHLDGYGAYGFGDQKFKYSLGGGFRLAPKSNTWIDLSYTDDIEETGSSTFLTDKRFFTFFQPRLLNIELFHRHVTKSISISHKLSPKLLSEVKLAVSNINPTYDYTLQVGNKSYQDFDLTFSTFSFQWSPFSIYEFKDDVLKELKNGYPKFTLQYTQNFRNVFASEFDFSKVEFRSVYVLEHKNKSKTGVNLWAGIARGVTPLTHMYHAYPNNINKGSVMKRFSVAGINSFETMFFNEFFSDKLSTLQIKHYFKPFEISPRYQPQLVLISRFALGNMSNIERHQGFEFDTLDKGYSEIGLELNKILFPFGLSFAYRYGAYHLPNFEDNLAFKFTFNLTL